MKTCAYALITQRLKRVTQDLTALPQRDNEQQSTRHLIEATIKQATTSNNQDCVTINI